ncbi:MAG: phosphatidylinositol-specific phospholipase C domain-containing protein [Clostridia bacterium]
MKKPMTKRSKIVALVSIYIGVTYLLITCASFIGSVVSANREKQVWIDWQLRHMEVVETAYANGSAPKVSEQSFCGFDLNKATADNVKFNQLQYLATHNSYKTGLTSDAKFFYNVPLFAIMGHKFDYYFDSITEQLNQGIRSIELDPNKVKTKNGVEIQCIHSDLLETNSTMVNFGIGLNEIKLWMDYNSGHLPIIVMLEPKNKQSYDDESFTLYEKLINETFGEKVIKPSTLLGGYSDFDAMRKADAYPTVGELRGKILFLIHDKKYVDNYINHGTMQTWTLLPALNFETLEKRPDLSKYTCMAISNNAKKDKNIRKLIDEGNFMVRTRLDEYSKISKTGHDKGIEAGANILSTDYPPSDSNRYDYTCTINDDGDTVILRKSN